MGVIAEGIPRVTSGNKVTPVSLGYPLTVFKTLLSKKERKKEIYLVLFFEIPT